MELAVILIIGLVLGVGIAAFIVIRRNAENQVEEKEAPKVEDDSLNLNIVSDVGMCRVVGNKEKFEMYFEGEAVGFVVKDGVITQYKSKSHPRYVDYVKGA